MNENDNILTLTDVNFQYEVLQSKQPVLVVFETDWFGGAHILAPVVKYLAEKYQGKLKVGKFNLDDYKRIPKKYGILEMITILLFKNGELMHQIFGMVDRETLEEQVVALL
jgi:thioredoxin 1